MAILCSNCNMNPSSLNIPIPQLHLERERKKSKSSFVQFVYRKKKLFVEHGKFRMTLVRLVIYMCLLLRMHNA